MRQFLHVLRRQADREGQWFWRADMSLGAMLDQTHNTVKDVPENPPMKHYAHQMEKVVAFRHDEYS